MRRSIILNSPSIANIFRQALTSQDPDVQAIIAPYMKSNSSVPYDVLEQIQGTQNWGFWKAYFSLYGSVEMLPALRATIKRAFAPIEGVTITAREFPGVPGRYIKASEIKQEEIPHSGIPTLAPLVILNSRSSSSSDGSESTETSVRGGGGGGGGHIDYSPILPPTGEEFYAWYLKAKQRTIAANFDFFADFHVYPRYVNGIELILYTPGEEERVHELYRTLVEDGVDMGYIPYRTHVSHMGELAGRLDFNEGVFGRVVGQVKRVLDPNGVLGVGKSGIW